MNPATITCPLYQLTSVAATIAGVSHSRVFSRERSTAVCRVRFAVWHIFYHFEGWTLQRIAASAGYNDHSTIFNGLRRTKQIIDTDPDFRRFVRRLLLIKI